MNSTVATPKEALRRLVAAALLISLLSVAFPGLAANLSAPYPPSESEWPLIGGGSFEQHFSPLRQINDTTVKQLSLAWFADMPTPDGLTGIPLVADGVIYQSGALGKVWANDVRTGRLLWSYDAQIKFPLGLVASWGSRTSRGLALWQDKVLKATGDCRLIALDRKSGARLWEVQSCDPMNYKTISGAPRVGGGKVFIGNANADTGIGRGYVDAYDIATGKHLWRFFTVPGDPAKGFENAAMEMASKTWGKDYWPHSGGGSAWDGITYDPVTNLVYIGTDGPAPYDPPARGSGGGDELFTNAIVAVNVDSGEYVWHYSTTPGDGWNYDATMPVVLADLPIGGETRHVVMVAPKNGFFYVLDSRTGKLVNEPKSIIPVNWASRIDMATGRPVLRDEAKYWLKGQDGAVVSPSTMGAHGWMPMSYSPQTGLVYIPTMDMPIRLVSDADGHLQEDFYYALDHDHKLPFKGSLLAWDPISQRERWTHDVGRPFEGGILSTAGNVVFQGTTDGYFIAYRADTGEKLWSFFSGSRILGAPSTVQIDGKQLILVAAGSGSTSGGAGILVKLSGKATGPSRLLAFTLGGTAHLPPLSTSVRAFPKPAAPEPDPVLVEQGKALFESRGCELCHGLEMVVGQGSVPDLRRINSATYQLFSQIVRGGLFKDAGMPIFADTIREDELPALKAYIMSEAWKSYRQDNAARNPK
jgi:PQQ-dependent dehydrogenase (methanol/ethanol family)